jgi:hypothetical protein
LRTDGLEEALAAPPLDFVGFGVAAKSEAVVALDDHLIGNHVSGESGKKAFLRIPVRLRRGFAADLKDERFKTKIKRFRDKPMTTTL